MPSARVDAELLASHLVGVERGRLGLVPLVEPEVIEAYYRTIEQRAKRIPLQYITGTTALGNIDVEVGPGVFVPRPETELLLGWALAFVEGVDRKPPVILDLCTGSGALALGPTRDPTRRSTPSSSIRLRWRGRAATQTSAPNSVTLRSRCTTGMSRTGTC